MPRRRHLQASTEVRQSNPVEGKVRTIHVASAAAGPALRAIKVKVTRSPSSGALGEAVTTLAEKSGAAPSAAAGIGTCNATTSVAAWITEYNFPFAMPLAPHSRLGPYEIIGSLGAGGMGEVYRARDLRLGRDVALKVLSSEVTGDPERLARFDREARVIAALNHPHIVTIYSTEEIDGIRCLTMELVEGQTLAEVIVSGGLGIARFLAIAVPLADALTAAHAKHITHRDLKPGNVMLSHDGRVKVLDFGLARVGGGESGEPSMAATLAPVTQHGMVVGTMPYMSPEQVEGRILDSRTDLFSLGVIFYELLTGERPFQGASSPALMSAILRDVPSSVSTIRADVPDSLARLIARCLEKQPEDRVQTARDVYNELRHLQKHFESGGATAVTTSRHSSSSLAPPATSDASLRVAVMPFTAGGGNEDAAALAEGLTDDITTGLSRFGNLRVISRAAAEIGGPGAGTREQAARYVLDGAVRKAGGSIRVTVRLADTQTGANLWAENYDRDSSTGVFALQDDLASRVVATVGDPTGVLTTAMAASLADKPLDQMNVAELVVRYFAYTRQLRQQEHGPLRAAFERALAREPRSAEGWACLAVLYGQEYSFNLNPLPDPIGRQRRAAERAVEIDSQSQHAWSALARAHLAARDEHALRGAADRAVALNPLNADAVALTAVFLSGAGDFDRAVTLAERAMALKPNHAGWYHFPAFNAQYGKRAYEEALRIAKLMNLPLMPLAQYSCAAAAGQLGRAIEARPALEALRRLGSEHLDPERARRAAAVWFWDTTYIDDLVDGFRKALALDKPEEPSAKDGRPASDAGVASAFVVTVLPLQAPASGDAAALGDGLTQGVVVGLSRFRHLRVVTRHVSRDAVTSGFVLQGSVREAGGRVRVVVQLLDAATGANVWAETYDRPLAAVSPFELQDDLIATIVATIADPNGALVRSFAAVVRSKPLDALTPYEAVLRRYAYISVHSPGEHAVVRDALERAVQQAPAYAAAWGVLAQIYVDEYSQQFNPRPDPLERARAAAYKALEMDQSSPEAHLALAMIGYFSRDMSAFRAAVDRTLALNPLDTSALAMLGTLIAYSGDWEHGMALCARARALNTQYPSLYWMSTILDHYRRHDYVGALEILNRVNMPGYPNIFVTRAAIYGQLGRIEEGRAQLREAEARLPGLSQPDSPTRQRWLGRELSEQVQEGLDKVR